MTYGFSTVSNRRGRPPKLDALTPAERARRYRERRANKGVTEKPVVAEAAESGVTEIPGVLACVTEKPAGRAVKRPASFDAAAWTQEWEQKAVTEKPARLVAYVTDPHQPWPYFRVEQGS